MLGKIIENEDSETTHASHEFSDTGLKQASSDALADRAKRVEEALVHEAWLPFGLRSLMASELPQIRKDLLRGLRSRAQRNVHRLALVSYRYGPTLLDSEAVVQLRVLDLELGPGKDFGLSRGD